MMKMKKQRDCKNPIILLLRRPESMLEWLKQPSGMNALKCVKTQELFRPPIKIMA